MTGLLQPRGALEPFQTFILVAPILLFSVVAHEYAHGYAALLQGDTTAQSLGRLTWNPIKHIDPFLTILMPLVMFMTLGVAFGGAKPVPVDPRNYRNYRRGDIIVSLAGIAANLALAVLLTVSIVAMHYVARLVPALSSFVGFMQVMFIYGITINLLLAVFNLMPIPPLDGSHVVKHLLPPAWARQYQRLAGVGFLLLIALVVFGEGLLLAWLEPVFFLGGIAINLVAPFVIPSPWTS